ncbi:MAG: hypothetical protein K2L07_10370 [Lachnospiraceae bacterium]|nr:hypothetical protein [Lachnospiraceae bacterium]
MTAHEVINKNLPYSIRKKDLLKSGRKQMFAKASIEMLTESKQGLRCMAGVLDCHIEGKQKQVEGYNLEAFFIV